jgi:hypothetical protein
MFYVINEYSKDTDYLVDSILVISSDFLPIIKNIIAINIADNSLFYSYKVDLYQIAKIAKIIGKTYHINSVDNYFYLEPK